MNDEQRLADTLRDFYVDDDASHDRDAILRDVLDSARATPQQRRRRWWPFHGHTVTTSTLPDRELQPDPRSPIPGEASGSNGSVPALFGAFKFALAGVIVALFGGFVLLDVLSQPSQDGAPGAVSTSVSITPSPHPSEDPMQLRTPAATVLATALAIIPTNLLAQEPGFVGEQVEPGVERIIGDGEELSPEFEYEFLDIAAGPDGDIWVVGNRFDPTTGTAEGMRAWELGSPGKYAGIPEDFTKLVILADGTPAVVGSARDNTDPVIISVFDGERFVETPGTTRIDNGTETIWLIEPDDLSTLGPGFSDFWATQAGVLAFAADLAGYTMGHQMGRRMMTDWPSWWVACQPELVDYRGGDGCQDRPVQDQRGVGVGHDDESRALFLADVVTTRLARATDGSMWVIGGNSISDFRDGISDEAGAIYRIDRAAPGYECRGC